MKLLVTLSAKVLYQSARFESILAKARRLLKAKRKHERKKNIYIYSNFISFRLLFHNFIPMSPTVNANGRSLDTTLVTMVM